MTATGMTIPTTTSIVNPPSPKQQALNALLLDLSSPDPNTRRLAAVAILEACR